MICAVIKQCIECFIAKVPKWESLLHIGSQGVLIHGRWQITRQILVGYLVGRAASNVTTLMYYP